MLTLVLKMLSMFCLLNVEDQIGGSELQLGLCSVFQVLEYHHFFGVEQYTVDCNHYVPHILLMELHGMFDVSTAFDPVRLLEIN